MSDFLFRARETAEREAKRTIPSFGRDNIELTYSSSALREYRRGSYRDGFNEAVPRLPSEEEISKGLFFQRVSDNAAETAPEIAKLCDEAARAVRELIEKKILAR